MLALGLHSAPVMAADQDFDTPSKAPLPRWAMLRYNEVNARNGPSVENRKLWTYRKANVPVQIISETKDWRLICDPNGGVAWVSKTLLRNPRTVITPPQRLEMKAGPQTDARVKAVVQPRTLAQLETCKNGWCRISVGGQSGWAPKSVLWGTQATPVCQRPNPLALTTAP